MRQPYNQSVVSASSGNVANANAVATINAPPSNSGNPQTLFCTGFEITGVGATSALAVIATLTGIDGGTISFIVTFPTISGAVPNIAPLVVEFEHPLRVVPGSNLVLTLPAGGAGNTNACVNLHAIIGPANRLD